MRIGLYDARYTYGIDVVLVIAKYLKVWQHTVWLHTTR